MIDELYRAEWGRLLSLLVARTRRLDLAEDSLAEAFARAAERWPREGAPNNPAGWLYTTAYRYQIGRIRAEAVAGRNAARLVVRSDTQPADETTNGLGDERLDLILLCCHPALRRESRSALALRLVIGTSTEDIARLFLVPTPTMAARLTRAKRKIVVAGIPLAAPVGEELAVRLDEVCRTAYLAFTAGYTPASGPDLLRADLAGEALRLVDVLRRLVPEAPQVQALLALLVLQHARRDAREADGVLITLPEQDRSRWHRAEVERGLSLVTGLHEGVGYAEELRLQAMIAAEHAIATDAASTDWHRIEWLYERLESMTGSAIVRLNRSVAIAEARGPKQALSMLDGLDALLPMSHRLAAVRADFARRAGDVDRAAASYRAAIEWCTNAAERTHLQGQLASLLGNEREAAGAQGAGR